MSIFGEMLSYDNDIHKGTVFSSGVSRRARARARVRVHHQPVARAATGPWRENRDDSDDGVIDHAASDVRSFDISSGTAGHYFPKLRYFHARALFKTLTAE